VTASAPAFSYRLLSLLLFPLWLAHAIWLAIKHRQSSYFWQRVGWQTVSASPCVWLHASSVGEVELIRPLAEELHQSHTVLLTTFTATGYQHAQRIMPKNIHTQVMPIDFYPLSRRFVRRANIRLGIIAETELWPETLYQLKKQDIDLLSVNTRLTVKSLQAGRWARAILIRTLGYFDRHITRSSEDSHNLQQMQVKADRIDICGNLKLASLQTKQNYPDLIGRPYVLFASTHAPEEAEFAQMFSEMQSEYLCVIAPRHPQRGREIMTQLNALTPQVSQRSKQHPIQSQTEIYLADTLGELKALMQHAAVVVMGGSFHQVGGHNVLEAAALGKVIITGPSDSNIRQDIQLLQQYQAIIQVDNLTQLKHQLHHLLKAPQQLEQLNENAHAIMQYQQQTLDCYLQRINGYL